jgi:hypothetical protein
MSMGAGLQVPMLCWQLLAGLFVSMLVHLLSNMLSNGTNPDSHFSGVK